MEAEGTRTAPYKLQGQGKLGADHRRLLGGRLQMKEQWLMEEVQWEHSTEEDGAYLRWACLQGKRLLQEV